MRERKRECAQPGSGCKRKLSLRCVDFVEMLSRLWSPEENQESHSAPKLLFRISLRVAVWTAGLRIVNRGLTDGLQEHARLGS